MVLLSLGILFASFTYLLYRVPPSAWPHLIPFWRQKHLPQNGNQGRILDGDREEREEKSSSLSQVDEPSSASLADQFPPLRSAESHAEDNKNLSDQTTPRASAVKADEGAQVPHLRLECSPPPNIQKLNSHTPPQSISSGSNSTLGKSSASMPPPPLPSKAHRPSSLLIPPTTTPTALRPLPRNPNTLNPPPSAASALRTPPSRPLSASISTLPPTSRPSKKVLLTPGHSPLDWAYLTSHPPTPTFLRGSEVPTQLIRVSPSMLKHHNGRKGRDAWGTWQGRVYNLTPYLKFHPGGEGELLRGTGKAGTGEKLFLEVHPWVNWEGILGECMVGILVGEGETEEEEGELEEMD